MALEYVIKRDMRKEPFDVEKLRNSIRKAVTAAGLGESDAEELLGSLLEELEGESSPFTMTISDRIVRLMVVRGISNPKWFEAAKRYELAKIYNDVYGKGRWSGFDPRDLLLSFNAIKVLEARYLLKDTKTWRYRETPQMMFRRVARHIARVDEAYGRSEDEIKSLEEEFYDIMSNLRFIPNSPTLMNAGTRLGILSACFVVPVRDSMSTPDGEGIMDAVRAQALIHQHGGGTGYDFSELRPENDVVSSSGGLASGPLSFMKLFDTATDVIKQGGKRRGANMGVMHVWHPDIEKFIKSKTGELKDVNLQNFNISVGFYDLFMKYVEEGKEWPLINPRLTDLRKGEGYDSRYYAIVRARHYMDEEWVQEVIIDELEKKGGSVGLDETVIVTLDEALAIAEEEGAIAKWVDAQKLFDEIVKGAWDSGDPGYLNIDVINRRHPTWYIGKINATNPCVSGDTRILTPRGWIKASELYEEAKRRGKFVPVEVDEEHLGEGGIPVAYEVELITSQGEEPIHDSTPGGTPRLQVPKATRAWIWYVGRKPALRVRTREGYEITVTREHKFLTPRGWREARDLKPGDKILLGRLHPGLLDGVIRGDHDLSEDKAFMLGLTIGGNASKGIPSRLSGEEDIAVKRSAAIATAAGAGEGSTRSASAGVMLETAVDAHVAGLPETVWRLPYNPLRAFLKGLFTAAGRVGRDGSIVLTSSSLNLLKDIQVILTMLGIYSVLEKGDAEKPDIGRGVYRLSIKGHSAVLFRSLIKYEDDVLDGSNTIASESEDSVWATIDSVDDVGVREFYDFTVPVTHSYIANGILNHNCGEEPLLPWESCNLGSINLEKYVIDTPEGPSIDWDALGRDVRTAVRFLDNVIDANDPPLRQIKDATRRTRKVGLGVMGWARMLIRLGIPYDSPDAIRLAWHVAEWIAWNAYSESIEIAREKGPFPAWDPERYRWLHETLPYDDVEDYLRVVAEETGSGDYTKPPSNTLKRILSTKPETNWSSIKEKAREHGMRNAALLSIAPTGSISIIAGASSSIEPLFALAFLRRVSVGEFFEVDPLFLEELAKREMDEPEVIEEIAQSGSVQHLKWIPRSLRRLFKTAHDIDPEWHLLHQAVWQAWIDAGTSKTINLRHDEPVETVRRVYLLAWKLGIKGTTVYRDKSKSQQVIYFGVKGEKEKRGGGERQGKQEPEEQPKQRQKLIEVDSSRDDEPSVIVEPATQEPEKATVMESGGGGSVTRHTAGRKRLRLGRGKVGKIVEVVVASEDYAGGCPTCDI